MSSKRGDNSRTRGQRYQNKFAFKNDLHDSSDKIKKLNSMHISEVCQKCRDVIEWKIKYRKYKPLTQPGVCNSCNQRNVRKAYHVLCHDCAIAAKKCAKCLKTASENVEIIAPEPSEAERIKMNNEMKQMVKSLSERKRRTFLRFMNGKKKSRKQDDDDSNDDEPKIKIPPPTKDELMQKLQQLNIAKDDDDFYDDILSSDEEGWASELSD